MTDQSSHMGRHAKAAVALLLLPVILAVGGCGRFIPDVEPETISIEEVQKDILARQTPDPDALTVPTNAQMLDLIRTANRNGPALNRSIRKHPGRYGVLSNIHGQPLLNLAVQVCGGLTAGYSGQEILGGFIKESRGAITRRAGTAWLQTVVTHVCDHHTDLLRQGAP